MQQIIKKHFVTRLETMILLTFFVHSSLYIAFEMGLGEMNCNLQSQD